MHFKHPLRLLNQPMENKMYRLGTPYTNLGNIYRQKGNFADALRYHQQALINFNQNPERYYDQIEQVKYNIAENLNFNRTLPGIIGLLYKTILIKHLMI